ncbi:MAG: magnesium transporter [Sphingomonadales bacterium]
MSGTPEDQNSELPDRDRQENAGPGRELSASRPAEEEGWTDLVRQLTEAVELADAERIHSLIEPLHSADLADVIGLMDAQHRTAFAGIAKDHLAPEVLSELEGGAFDQVIGVLEPAEIAGAVTRLETDDAVFVLEELDKTERQRVLENMPGEDRLAIEEALAYPEDSAGRMMQRQLVAVPPFWTVGQTLDYLRSGDDLPNDFWEIFVVDPHHRPIGTMPLSWAMRASTTQTMAEIMMVEQTLIPATMDQEEVAHSFRQYNLVSAAVTDATGRLVGMITVDDIVDVIDEEAEEDILALAGVSEGDVNISVASISRTRFGWLLLNLLTAILASAVILMFDASIEKLVALAVLMPIVASMGGNAGTQTMTVAVRAIATRELTSANALRIVGKELAVSVLNGSILAVVMGVIAAMWFSSPPLGMVIAAAMIINMIVAGLSGILVPMTLVRLDIDPAVASSVFVTTITDVIGFFAFLGLAAIFLI